MDMKWMENSIILQLYRGLKRFCCILLMLNSQIRILKFIINGGDVYNKRSQYLLITLFMFMW